MNHHIRSGVAIAFVLGYLGISVLLDHRPVTWEYVFLMFVVFSSAMQDALDSVNYRLGKVTRLLEASATEVDHLRRILSHDIEQQAQYLSRDIEQGTENLKSHITVKANLMKTYFAMSKYELELAAALRRGEDAPEEPKYETPYPEPKLILPKLVPLEPPKMEPFDAEKWRSERLRDVAAALKENSWLDMTVVTAPVRRLVANILNRPSFVNWLAK